MQRIDVKYNRDNLLKGLKKLLDNGPDIVYANGSLSEFNIHYTNFESNIEFTNCCYGILNEGTLPVHTDDGRESAMIIPITDSEMLLTPSKFDPMGKPFIIDTSEPHGAMTCKGYTFLSLDFRLCYNDITHLANKKDLYIKYVE